ncbi:MAG: transglutaminase domain-containing protein [Phycisphaerales bacterium]
MRRLLQIALILVLLPALVRVAHAEGEILTRHRTNVRDWTIRFNVYLRPDRQRKGSPVLGDEFSIPRTGFIQFESATSIFPILAESASHETYLDRLESGAVIKGRAAARATLHDVEGYPDEREIVYELGGVKMQDVLRFTHVYPMTCYETRIDEARAFQIEWPREAWPAEALPYLQPQAFVESDHADIEALVKAWTNDRPRRAKPYYLAKFLTGRVLEYYTPTEGIYREQGLPSGGRLESTEYMSGFLLQGAAHAARERKGSKNDLVNLLVAVYRAAGIPARLVIGMDPVETDKNQFPVFDVWAEFALYDEAADRLEWIPVDILEQRAFSSRAPSIEIPWEFFGKNRTLDFLIPIASRWEPLREGFFSQSDPALFGWVTKPTPQWCRQEVRLLGFETPMKPGLIELEKRKERSRPPGG